MANLKYLEETKRRRTFAIISHPDAGKTTLTEKLLLFSGAIQIAGSVKARKATRHATSDWMEIEKQRGISVASSVMQMLYRDHVINLLDTPGHKDFSEDTYRVLTAVDSALMVIDAANGVEAQTRRLIEVCRQRDTPIITFVNKMDREVREPLDILDEIERELGMPCVPMTWPVGQGKTFGGIINLRTHAMTVFEPSNRGPKDFTTLPLTDQATLLKRFGHEFETSLDSMELATGASPAYDHEAFLAVRQTPVFFGSGVNNFGVMEVLDALVDLAPSPRSRTSSFVVNKQPVIKEVLPEDEFFSGVVFKVQANMDANHRDRIAFVRMASGKYTPGMKLKVMRTAKELRPTSVVTFMSQRREAVEEAYAGDIVGFTTHGGVQLGDTITDGSVNLQFTGLPFFAPELFMTVILRNPLRTKQLQQGLAQLGEEGAIQVFRPEVGGNMLLGAVGQLQFEVVQHRLKGEYDADIRLDGCQYTGARWITADTPAELKTFCEAYPMRMARDAANTLAYLCTSPYDVRLAQERFPKIHFHPLREHAGLALQSAG